MRKNVLKRILIVIISAVLCGVQSFAVRGEEEISAKSAIVIDGSTGEILYEKNARAKMPMASTTKIMSALIALEQKNINQVFTVDKNAIKVEGSSMGLKEGDKVTLHDLCCGMLLPSGNDAANAAAVRISGSVENFVSIMNKRAKQMGLDSTHFVTPSGLDDYTDEHYSTAYDMAKLCSVAMKNKDFREICSKEKICVNFGNPPYRRWLYNSNKLLKNLEGCTGVKTGFTDKARRCLVSACKRNGRELIAVTLNAPDDWNDHKKMYEKCFSMYGFMDIYADEKQLYVNVAGGKSDRIKCRCEKIRAFLKKGQRVTVKYYLPYFVYAPIKENEKTGRAEFYAGEEKIGESDIFTDECCEYFHCETKE